MLPGYSQAETALNEVRNLLDTLSQLTITGELVAEFTSRLNEYKSTLNQLQNKCENVKNIAAEATDYYEIAEEEFKQVIKEATELKSHIQHKIPLTNENKVETLPLSWEEIQPDTVYQTKAGMLVTFSHKQILISKTKDRDGNHIRAIDKGEVPPQGHQGLVRSEEPGFDFKSKALGKKVSHYRFHGKMLNSILHFPGKVTNKK